MKTNLPEVIRDEAELEDLLSEPTEAAVKALADVDGDVILLGVAGKMGPTLARMVRRASDLADCKRRVIGVSRFSNADSRESLEAHGIETIQGDMLDEAFVDGLPDASVVIHMTGMKFGATTNPGLTWAMNTYVPALVCRRYRTSRIIAFSTGNVYPMVPVDGSGSRETDTPDPFGEYPMAALGRERMFEYFSCTYEIPTALIRLNYAVEMRYGVLVDIAQKVLSGEPIELATGHFNVIWQGDANAMTLAALADTASPPFVINVAGPEMLSTRQVAETFGRLFDRPPHFIGSESPTAYLNNGSEGHRRYGSPRVTVDQMIRWIADWLQQGKRTLGKPTHYEVRNGKF